MISLRCRQKNEATIPNLFKQWARMPTGEGVIDMSSAENTLMRNDLLQRMKELYPFSSLSEKDFSYSEGIGGPLATREALAQLLNTRFHPHSMVLPSQIILTAGGCSALDALIQQICDPGDGVLIATPYWSGLDISLSTQNETIIIPVEVPLHLTTNVESVAFYRNVLRQVERQTPVKALLLCNPTNPTGECYSSASIRAIAEFCASEKLHLISDEVYALSVHGGDGDELVDDSHGFTSVLSLEPTFENTHVIYSLSKDFGCSGIRMGALITQNNPQIYLGTALTVGPQISVLTAHLASTTILCPSYVELYIENNISRLQSAYALTTSILNQHDIKYVHAIAGPFLFAKLGRRGGKEEEDRIMEALKRENVRLVPGTQCHFNEWGWFRIVFALSRAELVEGLRRIVKVSDEEKVGRNEGSPNDI